MSRAVVEPIAQLLQTKLFNYRHYLHENPELSFQEYNTSKFIREKLAELNIPIRAGITGTSVLGEVNSGIPGPTILLRADMDALPIQEENEWAHKSKVSGVMHACGHDIHTAILLCVAEALVTHKELLPRGKVLLAFQAAEEKTPGGAIGMVKDGATQGVDMAFALHTGLFNLKEIGIFKGTASMATGMYHLVINGTGGHSAFPQRANDPIAALCDIAVAIQRLVPLRLDAQEPATVSVSYLLSGAENAKNVIPGSGVMGGTVRCSKTENRDLLFAEIEKIAKGVCQQRGCQYELDIDRGYPAMYNTPEVAEIVRSAALELEMYPIDRKPIMGGEDFANFQTAVPGAFYTVGICNPDRPETRASSHSSRYMPDENGAVDGLKMMLEICMQATAE